MIIGRTNASAIATSIWAAQPLSFRFLKKGKLGLSRSLAILLECPFFGVSVGTICLNLPVRAESTPKSQPLQRALRKWGHLLLLAQSYSCDWLGGD